MVLLAKQLISPYAQHTTPFSSLGQKLWHSDPVMGPGPAPTKPLFFKFTYA